MTERDALASERDVEMDEEFVDDLATVINRHSKENESNTPDFVLGKYLARCLDAFNAAVTRRAQWYGRIDEPARADTTREGSTMSLTAIPSTYVYRGQIEEAAQHLLAALEATSDHAPTTGHAEAARLVNLAQQNLANIYALAEEGATE